MLASPGRSALASSASAGTGAGGRAPATVSASASSVATASSYPPAGACATSTRRWRQWSNTTARSTRSRPIGGQGASAGRGTGCPSSAVAASYARYPISPPVSGGRSGTRGAASAAATSRSAVRVGVPGATSGSGRERRTSRTIRRSSRPTIVAAGSPAANEYRPQRSERSTLSSRMPGPAPASAGKTPTGVETSARSSVQTGTSGQPLAVVSNVSRSGRIRTGPPAVARCRECPCEAARSSTPGTSRRRAR
jgi:hypothetical protein